MQQGRCDFYDDGWEYDAACGSDGDRRCRQAQTSAQARQMPARANEEGSGTAAAPKTSKAPIVPEPLFQEVPPLVLCWREPVAPWVLKPQTAQVSLAPGEATNQ